jgi:hypothetical protein
MPALAEFQYGPSAAHQTQAPSPEPAADRSEMTDPTGFASSNLETPCYETKPACAGWAPDSPGAVYGDAKLIRRNLPSFRLGHVEPGAGD